MKTVQGYSADVEMLLHLNGQIYSISHMGADHIRLDQPAAHPPAEAEISLVIDGNESRRKVFLPEGLRLDHGRIPVKKTISLAPKTASF